MKVGAAPWRVRHGSKASEQGSSILPFATRVFIIFVIISEIQFSSWLSVRTDIYDKASEEVMNLNYLLFIFFIVIIIRVLPVRVGLFYSQGCKVAAEHHYNKPF